MARDTDDAAHSKAIQVIADTRQKCRQAILQLEAYEDVLPDTIFATSSGNQPHIQHVTHAYLLDFQGQLAPKKYSDKSPDLWDEAVAMAKVPAGAVVEDGDVDGIIDADATVQADVDDWRSAIDWGKEAIRLASLSKIWNMRVLTIEKTQHKRHHGQTTDIDSRRMWLPPKAARPIFDQLNAVLADLGLLMDVEMQTAADVPSTVPDHIREQAPAYQT